MSFLTNLASNATIEIKLDGVESRRHVPIKTKDGKGSEKLPLYQGDDDISGVINISIGKSKKLEHLGIRVELIGHIEAYYDKNQSSEFMSMGRELEPSGILMEDRTYTFSFNKFDKQYETYSGMGMRLRYFLRVTINRQYVPKITKETDFAVLIAATEPEVNKNIKMDVGIEECLHIEFEYNKSTYHLKDCVIGKVYFQLIRLKIKMMEISIIKRETYGSGPQSHVENDTIAKYEVMDGCPAKGEIIPIRMYLASFDLGPTFKTQNNRFSVKYFLNLVLIDEDDRRYFKQQEITLWRKYKA